MIVNGEKKNNYPKEEEERSIHCTFQIQPAIWDWSLYQC